MAYTSLARHSALRRTASAGAYRFAAIRGDTSSYYTVNRKSPYLEGIYRK